MFIAFRLKPGRDDDLINWIKTAGENDRSYYIREALRQGLHKSAPAPSSLAVKLETKQKNCKKKEINETDLDANLSAWS